MSFQNLSKASILYIEALDPFAIDTANNSFDYKGATLTAPGNTYSASVATRNNLAYSSANQLRFRRVSEHNRQPLSINIDRIEQSSRMANGTTRKYFVADKLNISVSWEMLPSFRNETVDGAWGAEDIKNFYESTAGRGAFRIKLNPTVFSPDLITDSAGALSDDYTYTVMFTSCDFTLIKRGLQPFWSVNITLEQV
jgi:hypothetical protein